MSPLDPDPVPEPGPRLRAVAAMVPPDSHVADIGTDHGQLPLLLLSEGRARRCIATEPDARRWPPALRRAARQEYAGRLELREGRGIGPLKADDAIDVVTVSGLGARTLVEILSPLGRAGDGQGLHPHLSGLRRVVLQPQSEVARLRRWLIGHRFEIVDERIVDERSRYYVALAAEPRAAISRPRHDRLDDEDLQEAGPCLVRCGDPLVARYWARVLQRQDAILLRATPGAARSRAEHRRDQARRILTVVDPASKHARLL